MSNSSIDLGSTIGVLSLNSLTGALTLVAGSGITIVPSGSNITISAIGSSAITSINSDTTTAQTLTIGTSGTDFNTVDNGTGDHKFNLPTASSINRGALSPADWSTFNGKQAAGNYITSLTGDATASGPGNASLTLATVNANAGSFGNASNVATFTVNGKGLITAATNVSIQITESQVTNLVSDLSGKQPTGNYITALSGDLVAAGPGAVTSTIQPNVISNSKLAQMVANTMKGNNTGSTANAADLTVTQGRSLLGVGAGFQFITSGVTYTTPSTITTSTQFRFTIIGGGGGGGGFTASGVGGAGGGSSGGGKLYITGLTPSTAYTISIGSGGAGGIATIPGTGSPGTATTLIIGATTYTANGGGGATGGSTNANGGAGGTAINCSINITGQNGNGGDNNSPGAFGTGGSSPFGMGLGGASLGAGGVGNPGTGYGSGGGSSHGTAAAGGNGAAGAILVEWFN